MKLSVALLTLIAGCTSTIANAGCFDDVEKFAVGICGEINKSGKNTVVDAKASLM